VSKTTDLQVAGFAPGVASILQFDFVGTWLRCKAVVARWLGTRVALGKAWEVYPMAALLYVLLAVGYGLSVWSLARQRRYTPLDRLTPARPASASRTQLSRASVTRRSPAAAA
jgi:hypothetical protein